MSESPYVAMREFIRVAVELEVRKAIPEVRSALLAEIPKEGPPGKDGSNGIDGRGIEGLKIQDDGTLAVRYTDKTEVYTIGKVVGKDGKDGAPGVGEKGERGADGINGKDGAPSIVPGPAGPTGERGANGIATREEIESVIEERFADVQVRSLADVFEGVYDHSKLYPPGRIAVLDGQSWLSMVETRAQPGVSSDWKLLAKKGRDGRDKSK